MLALYLRLKNRINDESGQTAVEYCLMIGLIGLALAATSPAIVTAVTDFFTRVAGVLATVGTAT